MAARDDTKRFFPGLGGIYDSLEDWAYPLLRATAGGCYSRTHGQSSW